MKRILIYGDSNTWGYMPGGGRYTETQTWPVILQQILGGNYQVFQQGLPGRVAGDYENEQPERNGQVFYEVAVRTALPVDYVIIALGTNDLKEKYARTSRQIFDDLMWYRAKTLELAHRSADTPCDPKFIYFLLPPVRPTDDRTSNEPLRKKVNDYIKRSGEPVVSLEHLAIGADGVHFTAVDHQLVAQEVFATIRDGEAY